jgi:hypothetical protein
MHVLTTNDVNNDLSWYLNFNKYNSNQPFLKTRNIEGNAIAFIRPGSDARQIIVFDETVTPNTEADVGDLVFRSNNLRTPDLPPINQLTMAFVSQTENVVN